MSDSDKTKKQRIRDFDQHLKRYKEMEKLKDKMSSYEEELQNSEERLKLIYEYAPDAYYINDLTGRFIDGNLAAEELIGYSREELVGKSFLKVKVLSPEGKKKAAQVLAKNLLGQPTGPDEFLLNRKDRSQVMAEIRTYPIKIKGKPVVLGIARDITERKRAENKLRASEELYRQSVENSPNPIFMVDRSGKIQTWNFSCRDVFLYSEKKIIGQHYHKLLWDEKERKAIESLINLVFEGASFNNQEIIYKCKTGQKKHCISRMYPLLSPLGEVDRCVFANTDITERKMMEEELKKHRDHLEELVEERTTKLKNSNEKLQQEVVKRREAERFVAHRLDFEKIVSSISSRFVYTKNYSKTVDYTLQKMGKFCDVDRVYVFLLDQDKRALNNTHEWCKEGVEPQIDNLQNLPSDSFKWWMERLCKGEMIQIDDVSKMPKSAKPEREILESQDIKAVLVIPLYSNGNLAGFIGFDDVRKNRMWDTDDMTLLRIIAEILGSCLERTRTEKKLEENERKFRLLVNKAQAGIYELDIPTNKFTSVNDNMCRVMGYSREEFLEMNPAAILAGDSQSKFLERVEKVKAGKRVSDTIEYKLKKKNDEELWALLSFSFLPENGRLSKVIAVAQDITESKEMRDAIKVSLREKEVLLKEIHHRVKNNMQIISSLLNLQAQMVDDQKIHSMFHQTQNRIRSMGLIHEKLYKSDDLSKIDFAKYIRSLVTQLFRAFNLDPEKIKLNFMMDSAHFDIDTAIPLGLLINELITNSFKHAFPAGREGEIKIRLKADKKGGVVLNIGDDGIGFPKDLDFRNTESLGMQLVNDLVNQINGRVELDRAKGTSFKITF